MRHSSQILSLKQLPKRTAEFIEPMDCTPVSKLIDGPEWVYEIKLDGYRAIAVRNNRGVSLFSRRHKSFNRQYPYLVEALGDLPEGTVVDGEVVAIDESGRPNFNLLQSFRSQASRIRYFIFDMLVCDNRDLTTLPLDERRKLTKSILKPRSDRIRIAEQFETSANDMLGAVCQQQLEGVVAKRKDSLYEPGKRTGSWVKFRINRAQELVIGGFIPGSHGLDSIIVGYYRSNELVYVARVRNGFVPATRRHVYEKLKPLVASKCLFVNLPETGRARWGDILDAEKMKKCVWVRPELVGVVEFLDWTEADRLRHARFVALRDDKNPREIVKEA